MANNSTWTIDGKGVYKTLPEAKKNCDKSQIGNHICRIVNNEVITVVEIKEIRKGKLAFGKPHKLAWYEN